MAQFKHSFHNVDGAAKAFVIGRRNKNGDVNLGNNTVLREIRTVDGTDYAVRLHDTNVVTFKSDGRVMLNTGGFYSLTTADRMNAFTPGMVRLNRRKGDFVLSFWLGGTWVEQGTFAQHFTIL